MREGTIMAVCPTCNSELVDDPSAGPGQLICPQCGKVRSVVAPGATSERNGDPAISHSSHEDSTITLRCHKCKKPLRIPSRYIGRESKCPSCGSRFLVPDAAEAAGRKAGQPNHGAAPPALPKAATVRSSSDGSGGHRVGTATPARPAGPPPLPRLDVSGDGPADGDSPPKGPPNLPPRLRSPKGAGGPPPIPRASGGAADSVVRFAVSASVRALSVQKLTYFVLGGAALALLGCLLAGGMTIAIAKTRSILAMGINVGIVTVLYAGLLGVLAGGMAHLTDLDERRQQGSVAGAFGACARKFGSLFGAAVLFGLIALGLLLMTNGVVYWLNVNRGVGSLLAGLLFLPQFTMNLALFVALAVGALIPIVVVVDDTGISGAIARVVRCVRTDSGHLLVHLAVSILVGSVITIVIAALVGPSYLIMVLSNSPLSGSTDGLWIRILATAIIALVILGYLSAYWIGTFTCYYRDMRRRHFGK